MRISLENIQPANQAYEDIPLDESAPDLLAPNSPSPVHHIHLHQEPRKHELKDHQLPQPHSDQQQPQPQSQQQPHHQQQRQQEQQQQQHQQQHQQQQQHLQTLIQHQSQLQQLQDSSRNFTYVRQDTPYVISETNNIRNYEYANEDYTINPCSQLEMRSDRGGEAGGGPKKGWKRKREEEGAAEENQYKSQGKIDPSQRCDVCGEQASGHYFGALVCLPCKSFFIRCTKDGRPSFNSQCGGKCDVLKGGRVRCQHCRFQKCISAGMYRKEKPEAVEPAEGQLLCKVCGDIANGVHFGVTTCEGCKKFFRRGLKENRTYTCKGSMRCSINPRMRNNCRYCRYQKCLFEGMSREAIKMGRPKKGELIYRKKNGYKQIVKADMKPLAINSGQSPLSAGYEQEDDPPSNDAFDDVSSQGQNIQVSHAQLNTQLLPAHQHPHIQQHQDHHQQPQPQHPDQMQHQSQAAGFSLGSLLHDCMTVHDWEDNPEMAVSSHSVQNNSPHAMVMTSAMGASKSLDTDNDKMSVSPHGHHTSPTTMHSELTPVLIQDAHHQIHHDQIHASVHQVSNIQLLGHIQENQPDAGLQQSPTQHMSVARQVSPYQDKENVHEERKTDRVIMTNLYNVHESGLSVVREVKVEGSNLVDGNGVPFSDGVILNGMQTLHTLSKVDLQNYQLQGIDADATFTNSEHNLPPISAVSATPVPIGQLEPSVVTVSVNPNNIIYAHADPDTVQQSQSPNSHHSNLGQERPNIAHFGNRGRSSIIINSNSVPQVVDMVHKQKDVDVSHTRVISSQGNLSTDTLPCNISRPSGNSSHHQTTSMAHVSGTAIDNLGSVILQQHLAESGTGNPQNSNTSLVKNPLFKSGNPISGRSTPGDSMTPSVASNVQPNNIISQAMAIASSSTGDMDGQIDNIYLLQGIKGHMINIDQEQSQSGQPFQFRNNNNPSNPDLIHESNISRLSTERDINRNALTLNQRRQRHDNYDKSPSSDQQDMQNERLTPINRLTPPAAHRGLENSSPHNLSGVFTLGKRNLQNKISPAHSSPESDNPNQNFPSHNIPNHIFKNGDARGVDISPDSYSRKAHLMPVDRGLSKQAEPPAENAFDANLLSDTAVLHGINRIFLAIDNSCDSYGCKHFNAINSASFRERSFLDKMSPDDFLPELSHMYWHSFRPSSKYVPTTQSRKRVILEVLTAFDNLQKTYATSEPEYSDKLQPSDQWEQWHLVQRRIARHVVAGQRFCRNIPGYFKLDIQDRISLGKHAGFGLMVLLSCTEFYDPEFKRFRYIWNLTLPSQNPLFAYKVHLLSLGERMHEAGVDRSEAALLCAISMTSIDCPGILIPSTICDVRDTLIDALEAHESTRTDSTDRVQKLLSFMPQVRHMTMWYNNLMKKMSLPTEVLTGKMSRARGSPASGSENKPSLS